MGLSLGQGESVCAPTTMKPAVEASTAPPTAKAINDDPLRLAEVGYGKKGARRWASRVGTAHCVAKTL
jgi:hypothetical protein